VEKTYLAVVAGWMEEDEGELSGFVERAHTRSRLASAATDRSKEAVLAFRVLARHGAPRAGSSPPARVRPDRGRARATLDGAMTLVEVSPRTGRHHQIRLQLSAAGHPIVGDVKYRAPAPLPDRSIALHAARLRIPHPVRGEIIELSAPPPDGPPWSLFARASARYFATA
jgi:23S rRNA pseudouridine1911/1915/1917 synthase